MNSCPGHTNGFTLMEVLLASTIIGLLAMVGAPVYRSVQTGNELDVATNVLVQDLYRAQSASRSEVHDNSWGVAINGQVITLYTGASYATRISAFDENYSVVSSVSLSGSPQASFAKLTGLPSGSASFTLAGAGKTRTVTVNTKGMVDY